MGAEHRKEVAKWARDLILSCVIVPAVLLYFNMTPLIMILGGGLSLVLVATVENWPKLHSRGLQLGPGIAIGICLVCLAAAGLWAARTWKPDTTKNNASPLDQTILLECALTQLPTVVPEGGLNFFELSSQYSVSNPGAISSSLLPGAPMNWDQHDIPSTGHKCSLSNFGAVPVLNVEADIKIDYLEVVKTENGNKSGAIIRTVNLTSPRAQLGIGDRNTFTFYLINIGPTYAQVTLPKTVRVQPVGTDKWQIVTLVPPRIGTVALFPFNRPEQAAVAPAPKKANKSKAKTAPGTVFKRLIAYENIGLEFDAASGGGVSISGLNLPVRNAGSDTIAVHLEHLTIGVNGDSVPSLRLGPFKETILPQTQTMPWHFKMQASPLSAESKIVTVEFEVDYDTIPTTGLRRSYKKIAFPLTWPNGLNNAPQTNPSIVDQWER